LMLFSIKKRLHPAISMCEDLTFVLRYSLLSEPANARIR
jgi:hypothetical protein